MEMSSVNPTTVSLVTPFGRARIFFLAEFRTPFADAGVQSLSETVATPEVQQEKCLPFYGGQVRASCIDSRKHSNPTLFKPATERIIRDQLANNDLHGPLRHGPPPPHPLHMECHLLQEAVHLAQSKCRRAVACKVRDGDGRQTAVRIRPPGRMRTP